MENVTDLVCTPREAAELCGVVPDAIVKAIRRGRLPARKSGGTWLISKYDLEARANTLSKPTLNLELPR